MNISNDKMAFNGELPPRVAGVVRRQYADVKAVHDQFSAMQKWPTK